MDGLEVAGDTRILREREREENGYARVPAARRREATLGFVNVSSVCCCCCCLVVGFVLFYIMAARGGGESETFFEMASASNGEV